MKKNIKNIFAILLILEIILEPFTILNTDAIAKTEKEYGPPFRGDLRCPVGSLNVDCFETIVNDEVTLVQVVKEDTNVKVVKNIEKNSIDKLNEATYNVWFDIEYKKQSVSAPHYVLIMDASGSMGDERQAAINIINSFASQLRADREYIDLSIVEYGHDASNARTYDGTFVGNQDGNISCTEKGCSRVFRGMLKAYEYLANFPNSDKYVIYFIDGDFIQTQNWEGTVYSVPIMKRYLDQLGTQYFGIRFKSSYYEYGIGNPFDPNTNYAKNVHPDLKNSGSICKNKWYQIQNGSNKGKYTLTDCFDAIVGYMTNGTSVPATNSASWQAQFNSIVENARSKYPPASISGSLVDNLGNYFSLSGLRQISKGPFSIVGGTPFSTEKYVISISNPDINNQWINTNAGFEFNYGFGKIESQTNPEVYWVQESDKHESCTDSTYFVKRYDYSTAIYESPVAGIEKTYLNTLYCRDEIRTNLIINNQTFGSKKFNILRGLGIPIEIDFAEQVTCYNRWHQDIYNSVKSRLENLRRSGGKNQTIANQEIAALEDMKRNYEFTSGMESRFNYYLNNIKNPTFKVKYDDNTEVLSNNEFTTIDESLNNASCSGNKCVMNVYKKYIIENKCLQLSDGKPFSCSVIDDDYIKGGNKYYFDMTKKSGTVSVQMLKTGFSGEFNVTMENNGTNTCEFDTYSKVKCKNCGETKVFYRPIDLKDPFVQQFKTVNMREIGRNFSSNRYNFINIIDSNIWNTDYEFMYRISKSNVKNIKNNTDVKSYLGSDCYINKNTNKYLCPFTRNIDGGEGNTNNFFSYVDLR